jgi:hypothetical protein
MDDYLALTTILMLGVAFGLFGRLALINLLEQIDKIKKMLDMKKKFKAKEAEVAAMKANGDFHEWKELPAGDGNTVTVCIKTGWAPSLKGFIPMENIKRALEEIKTAEEYKAFRDASITQLALDNNMSRDNMEKIVESVFNIKKQFHLKLLQDLSDSMKNRQVNLDVRTPDQN